MKSAAQHETLLKVRTLLADHEAWCKGDLAQDYDGQETDPGGFEAVAWCLSGARLKVGSSAILFESLFHELLGEHYIGWQDADTTTHADILSLLDRAIALPVEARDAE